ncbi:MAG: hypothetical protein QOI92_1523 [Chloroflexota bacterium]|nr:hypothetical protein [Chloroflexota bacterium]
MTLDRLERGDVARPVVVEGEVDEMRHPNVLESGGGQAQDAARPESTACLTRKPERAVERQVLQEVLALDVLEVGPRPRRRCVDDIVNAGEVADVDVPPIGQERLRSGSDVNAICPARHAGSKRRSRAAGRDVLRRPADCPTHAGPDGSGDDPAREAPKTSGRADLESRSVAIGRVGANPGVRS